MARNIFNTLDLQFWDDDEDDNLSEEIEMSDEEQCLPPNAPTEVEQDTSESDISDDEPTYTTLQPAVNNETPQSNNGHEHCEIAPKTILAKDQKTEWQNLSVPETRTPSKKILKLPKQRTPSTDHVKSSVDAFHLYFDEKMIQAIADYTNIEGAREKKVNGGTLTQYK